MRSPLGAGLSSFGPGRLRLLLGTLRGFAQNKLFDATGYASLFGVLHAGGQRYWPAVSHRELTDDFIEGYGDRELANALEATLNEAAVVAAAVAATPAVAMQCLAMSHGGAQACGALLSCRHGAAHTPTSCLISPSVGR